MSRRSELIKQNILTILLRKICWPYMHEKQPYRNTTVLNSSFIQTGELMVTFGFVYIYWIFQMPMWYWLNRKIFVFSNIFWYIFLAEHNHDYYYCQKRYSSFAIHFSILLSVGGSYWEDVTAGYLWGTPGQLEAIYVFTCLWNGHSAHCSHSGSHFKDTTLKEQSAIETT